MTKERLKELIKQHGIVYARKDNKIIEINLGTCVIDDNFLLIGYDLVFDDCEDCYDISCLYETREQAEWSLKMQAERTERFEPPMWEDLTEFKFNFLTKDEHGIYEEMKFLAIKSENFNEIILRNEFLEDYIIYDTHATKEKYEKACEIVRDLFVGGAK